MKKTIENCRRMRILAPEHHANIKCDDCRGRNVCPTSDYVSRDRKHEETVADIKYRIYQHWHGCENCSLEELDGADLIAIADRFEAAHRREMADFEATKTALANVIAEKKQFAEIAAKKDRDIGSLKIDIAILSDALFDLLSKAYSDEKYGRHQAMLAILNNGREGHFHKDEVIKMFRDEFCDCVVDHKACTVTRSEGSDR